MCQNQNSGLYFNPGPVVQSSISANPIYFNPLFLLCTCFKTVQKIKLSLNQRTLLEKHIQLYKKAIGKFDLQICANMLLNTGPWVEMYHCNASFTREDFGTIVKYEIGTNLTAAN